MLTIKTVAAGQHVVNLSGQLAVDVALAFKSPASQLYQGSARLTLRQIREALDEMEAALAPQEAETA